MLLKVVNAVKTFIVGVLAWWKSSRLGRAMRQYSIANGVLLAGGITYKALFSLFAGLTIGFTVFVRVLGNDSELRDSVIEGINNSIPGLIATPKTTGILSVDSLVISTTMNVTSVVAALVLLWSVLTGMEAVRSSIRAMFGLPPAGSKAFSAKLRSFMAFVCVAVALLLSALVGVIAGSLNSIFGNHTSFAGLNAFLLQAGSLLLTFVFDAFVFVLLVRVLAGLKPARRDTLFGAAIMACGFAVIRFLGASAVSKSASNNPLFATGAVLVTVLVWLYLCSRIVLTAAAFTANTPAALLSRLEDESTAQQQIEAFSGAEVPEVRFVTATEYPQKEKSTKKPLIVASLLGAVVGWLLGRKS